MPTRSPASRAPEPFDLGSYVPFYLSAISNRWTSTSSRIYLRRFGIGIVEWRVLAALAAKGQASSLDIVNLVGLDPASVSKAMRTLEANGRVAPVQGRFAGRTKPYHMTPDGIALFEAVREAARAREAQLLAGLSEAERGEFLRLLRKIHEGLPQLSEEM